MNVNAIETGGFEVEDSHEDTLGANLLHSGGMPMNRAISAAGLTPGRMVALGAGSLALLVATFIMSIAALAKADANRSAHEVFVSSDFADLEDSVKGLEHKRAQTYANPGCWFAAKSPGLYDFYKGDALLGEEVLTFNGHHYQVVGGNWAKFTWHDALMGSWTRCRSGVQGHLATIESKEENDFLVNAMTTDHGYSKLNHNSAWIGLTDMVDEGSFKWVGTGVTITTPEGDVPSVFTSWNIGEPSSNGEEDCVALYDTGRWNDDSCYKTHQYYFVEYDDPVY